MTKEFEVEVVCTKKYFIAVEAETKLEAQEQAENLALEGDFQNEWSHDYESIEYNATEIKE